MFSIVLLSFIPTSTQSVLQTLSSFSIYPLQINYRLIYSSLFQLLSLINFNRMTPTLALNSNIKCIIDHPLQAPNVYLQIHSHPPSLNSSGFRIDKFKSSTRGEEEEGEEGGRGPSAQGLSLEGEESRGVYNNCWTRTTFMK